MKKQRFILLILFLSCTCAAFLQAQEYLPQKFSVALGGGVTLPRVEGNRHDFFNENGNRPGYDIMFEGRYYLTPYVALGAQYDYSRIAHVPDKMHLHYLRPNIVFRYLMNDDRQSLFLSLGIGYMDYQERTYKRNEQNGHLFHKGYCGLSLGMGYEFHIMKKVSGMFRFDIMTADWFANPDARLFNPNNYEDEVDHSWFKNNVTFFNFGFALQFGK